MDVTRCGNGLGRSGETLERGRQLGHAGSIENVLVVVDDRAGAVERHGVHRTVVGVEVHGLLEEVGIVKALGGNELGDIGNEPGVDHGLEILLADLHNRRCARAVCHVEEATGGLVVAALVLGAHLELVRLRVETVDDLLKASPRLPSMEFQKRITVLPSSVVSAAAPPPPEQPARAVPAMPRPARVRNERRVRFC